MVFQLNDGLVVQSWMTVQPDAELNAENRNCGVPQPLALAVNRTVVPTACGEAGFAERARLLQGAENTVVAAPFVVDPITRTPVTPSASTRERTPFAWNSAPTLASTTPPPSGGC
jgi:hypothetical protein